MSETETDNSGQEPDSSETKQRLAGGFPIVNLEKAILMMKKVWEKERRNPAPVAAIMEHWGYAAKSSGGFQAIASLKRFGLLEDVSGAQRTLKVTDAALNLLKHEETDPKAYRKLVKWMALLPSWYEMLWNKYGHELPSDRTLENSLVFDNRLEQPQAKLLMRTFKETISFAKLTEPDNVEETGPIAEKSKEKGQKPPLVEPVNATITSGQLPIPIGDKVALVPFPMNEDDFELFIGTLNLWKKKLVRKIGPIAPKIALPAKAIWKNNDNDKPVTIVSVMGVQDGELFYQSQDGTGIPKSQLTFEEQSS